MPLRLMFNSNGMRELHRFYGITSIPCHKTPVTLPRGRARLTTYRSRTGSSHVAHTISAIDVAGIVYRTAFWLTNNTDTPKPSSSARMLGIFDLSLFA